MNRSVLNGIFVSNGDMYANDALQLICSKISNYDSFKVSKALEAFPKSGFNNMEEEKQHENLMQTQRDMINLFDMIVSRGEEFALVFIKSNYEWATGYEYNNIEKGQKYTKNGTIFIVVSSNSDKVKYHEEHFLSCREMDRKDFLSNFKLLSR